jgi:FMN phosphatase YigB (HAD superfamily)
MKLVITDLDNTLYDWVTYFAQAFSAMVRRLSTMLQVPEDQLLDEFKLVHQRHRNSEQPFALFEIATVRNRFAHLSHRQLKEELDEAIHEFNRRRQETLRLYPDVLTTLTQMKQQGITLVAHTEAIAANAYFRLKFLGIASLFKHLYAMEGHLQPHPVPERELALEPPTNFLRVVPVSERKPNPRLLLDICAREHVAPSDAVYVGDSLTRDISMAKAAGVKAVWAKYGSQYDRSLWQLLVRVTHWSPDDIRREEDLKRQFAAISPDASIDSFSELAPIVGLTKVPSE